MIRTQDLKSTKTTWSKKDGSRSSHLRLIISSEQSTSNYPVSEIVKLTHELSQIKGINRVQAIASYFPDIHWIDFQIELEQDFELTDKTWEKIQDMVIDYEWKLIDDTKEEWYFRPQIIDKFYTKREGIVADSQQKAALGVFTSDNEQAITRGELKILTSNSPIFAVF